MPDAALGGNLPKGDANGLSAMAGDLISDPERKRVIIAIVDNPKTVVHNITGDRTATVRICRLEAVLPGDLATAEKLMRRALEQRTGQTVLPLDLEDELTEAFAEVDPETGEIKPKPAKPKRGPKPAADEPDADPGDRDDGEPDG